MRKSKDVVAKKISLPRKLIEDIEACHGASYGTWAELVARLLVQHLLKGGGDA